MSERDRKEGDCKGIRKERDFLQKKGRYDDGRYYMLKKGREEGKASHHLF